MSTKGAASVCCPSYIGGEAVGVLSESVEVLRGVGGVQRRHRRPRARLPGLPRVHPRLRRVINLREFFAVIGQSQVLVGIGRPEMKDDGHQDRPKRAKMSWSNANMVERELPDMLYANLLDFLTPFPLAPIWI